MPLFWEEAFDASSRYMKMACERSSERGRMSMLDPARCAIEQNFARAMLAVAGEGGEMLPRHGVFVQAIGTDHVRRAHHVGEPPDGGSWC